MNNKVWLSIKKNRWWILIFTFAAAYYGYMAFMALARHHFKAHCENDAGEFIYKTVENVEGIYQMRPRKSEDYVSNLRRYRLGKGDLLEDPFGFTNAEANNPHTLFLGKSFNGFQYYQYLETEKVPDIKAFDIRRSKEFDERPKVTGEKYWVYSFSRIDIDGTWQIPIYHVEQSSSLKSRYGFTWREVRSRWDKLFGIWGGELLVKDLTTDETLAIRRGYFSFNFGICPKDKGDTITYRFLNKVLKPVHAGTK